MTTTAEHLRNTLDGRWRDMKNRMRDELSNEVFRPHYTPNTVIARTKVAEQMKIMAANGAAEDGFKKEHGGNGDVGAAVTQIEMLAMSDLSLMVKAGVQWGLFGGAVENLGTERHHKEYVQRIINLDLLGCFAMTETGHGSDVQALETTATYDPATQEFVIDSPTRTSRKDYIGGAAETARVAAVFAQLITPDGRRPRRALLRGADSRRRRQRPARRDDVGLPLQGRSARCGQRPHPVRPRPRAAREPAQQVRRRRRGRHVSARRSRTPVAGSSPCWAP